MRVVVIERENYEEYEKVFKYNVGDVYPYRRNFCRRKTCGLQ